MVTELKKSGKSDDNRVTNKAYTPIGEDWYANLDEKLIVAPCGDEKTRCVFKIIKQ